MTDCSFIGRKVNSFKWEEFDIKLVNGRYCKNEGKLAGSAILMIEAIVNTQENLHCTTREIIEMATSRVAKAIDIENLIGFIKPGYLANFFTFDNNLTREILSF